MIQVFIKYTDNNFYLLDLDPAESINYKLTVKDLNDITKIFSPFTQSFKIPATDKNKRLCGFIGNEKTLKLNNAGEFDSMIYISGFLFQSGKLTFEQSDYEFQDQKEFQATFANNLSSLTDKLGDSTIQELFQDENGNFDPLVKTVWDKSILKARMSGIKSNTLSNGIVFKFGIPFISNNRVWNYNENNLSIVDNIAYKLTKTTTDINFINLNEVRPAVNYMSIMNHLLLKIGTPVICPIFEKPEVNDLFAWCNSESLVVTNAAAFPLETYSPIVKARGETKDDPDGTPLPTVPRWTVTETSGVFKIKRDDTVNYLGKWSDGININVDFSGLVAIEGTETKIKVNIRRTTDNAILNSQEITGSTFTWRLIDAYGGVTQLDSNGEIYLKVEVLPLNLVKWNYIRVWTEQKFRYDSKGFLGVKLTTRATFGSESFNYTNSENLGGNQLNLISCLPKMKCVDFLKSFFKTFNISVISTGLQDQSMFWVTPNDLKEVNKPYSKRIVDYTQFTNIDSLVKKRANQYNQYSFSHFNSKYYEATYGDGTKFGELQYPAIAPTKPTKFEVKTDYSIIKQSNTFAHPATAKTCLGFVNEPPTVNNQGGNRFKPVYEEFTIFYLEPKRINFNPLSLESFPTQNNRLDAILEASFKCSNGKTLAFGAEGADTDSLYLNYYDEFIELLLSPNTYKSEFNLVLPPNEIFLNFANLKQGESNIPTGFRAQNEIIIGEQRYQLQDSIIDLTTGKTKLTLLNF
jgi:hypothetical protein